MKILILGGTQFLGRHLVDSARRAGHEVTLFNRGKTAPELFKDVDKIPGDRNGRLEALRGKTFDVVIDTSGFVPRLVQASAALLRPQVGRYIFVSSISVYAQFDREGMNETSPVAQMPDPCVEDVETFYGPLKALSEQAVTTYFGQDSLIVRPGLIVGPDDPTDRFTYWVRRFSGGGHVLVPGSPHRKVQFIDARDLADWMIRAAQNGLSGTYHATGPAHSLTMGEFVSVLQSTLAKDTHATFVTEDFLARYPVAEWTELPLWIAESTGWPGFLTMNIERALATGLTFRPLSKTIRDTWEWDRHRTVPLRAGMESHREATILADWSHAQGTR